MNKYQIKYTKAKGREITAISHAETRGIEAAEWYFLFSGPTDYGPYAYIEKVEEK